MLHSPDDVYAFRDLIGSCVSVIPSKWLSLQVVNWHGADTKAISVASKYSDAP
jgi:hypothetical protein